MIWEMNLNSRPFELIKSGRKEIEMRLFDERRRNIKIGDDIVFTNNATQEKLLVEVVNLYRFDNFEELYKFFDKTKLGYLPEEEASPKDMEEYYPLDKILHYGVLGIEIKLK